MRRVGAVPYAQAYYTPNIEEVQRSFVDKKKEWIRDLEQSADKVEQARISMQNNFVAKNNTSSLGMSASAYQKAMQPLRYTPEDKLIIQTLVSGLPSTQTFANYDPRVKLINFLSQFSDQFKIQQREELIRLLQDTVYYIIKKEGLVPAPTANGTMLIATKLYNKIAGVPQAELAQPVSQALTMNAQAVNIGQLTPAQKKKILSNSSLLFGTNSLENYIVKQIYENDDHTRFTQIGKILNNQSVTPQADPPKSVNAKTYAKLLLESAIDAAGSDYWQWRLIVDDSEKGNPDFETISHIEDSISDIENGKYEALEELADWDYQDIIYNSYGWTFVPNKNSMILATTVPFIGPVSDFITNLQYKFDYFVGNYQSIMTKFESTHDKMDTKNKILKILRKFRNIMLWPIDIRNALTDPDHPVSNIEFDKDLIEENYNLIEPLNDAIKAVQLGITTPAAAAGPSVADRPAQATYGQDDEAVPGTPDKPDDKSLYSDDVSADIDTPAPTGQGLGKKLNKALSKEIGKIDAYKAAGGNNSQTMTKAAILRRMLRR